MAVSSSSLTRSAKVGQRVETSLNSLTANAAAIQTELGRKDPSSFFVTLQVAKIVGTVSGELDAMIDDLRDFREEVLTPTTERLRTAERVSDRLDPIFDKMQDVPVSVVKKAGKALDVANEAFGGAAGRINPVLQKIDQRLEKLDAKAQKFQKVLSKVGKLDEVAQVIETARQAAIDVAERDERDAAAIEQALIDDLDATVDAENETLTFDVPDPVAARMTLALNAFDDRLAKRSEDIREFLDRIDDFIDRLVARVPALLDLPDAPDLPDIELVMQDFLGDFQANLDAVLRLLDALDVLKTVDALGAIADVLDDFAGVLEEVVDIVDPILDFFGPVVSMINKAIEEVEDAIGLTDLLERIEQGLRNEIDKLIDGVIDKLDDVFDQFALPDFDLFEQIAIDLDFLKFRIGFFELNPVAQIGDDGSFGDGLDDRAIIAGLAGDDVIGLQLDDKFDDGFGGMALGGQGDDELQGTALADLMIGGDGDDQILGLGGDDMLLGVLGNDVISGGAGNDQAVGGDGADVISGDGGDDDLFGEAGIDLLFGGGGNDFLSGGADIDRLEGGAGDDVLDGGAGEDVLIATEGVNTLDGDAGLDAIRTIGLASAVNTIIDPTAVLTGGVGIDIVTLGDFYGLGFSEPLFGSVNFDAGGNADRFEAGNLDLDRLAARLQNFETLEITTIGGLGHAAKTLSTTTANLAAEFDTLELVDGGGGVGFGGLAQADNGEIVIAITDGVFHMDGALAQVDIDFSGMTRQANRQDGPNAGADDKPISDVIPVTVRLDQPGGGTVFGPEAFTAGLFFLGGDGDDFIVGGSGSDVIRAGLGADVVNGGRGDDGDRFDLESSVGDVILGTPEELDGDEVVNLSNRVDRVRVLGEDLLLQAVSDDGFTTVNVFEGGVFDPGGAGGLAAVPLLLEGEPSAVEGAIVGGTQVASFQLTGDFPKLTAGFGEFTDQFGATFSYIEIFNNNIPPTAENDLIESGYQGPGDEAQAIDPYANDFDPDTPADAASGVQRRQVAVTESLAALFSDLGALDGFADEDGLRIAFPDGFDVEFGDEFATDLGNKLILTESGLVYEARDPEGSVQRLSAAEAGPIEQSAGDVNPTLDLPFFGVDRIDYKAFDLEGELSNRAAMLLFVRPDPITLADGSEALPSVRLRGLGLDGTLEEDLVVTLTQHAANVQPAAQPEFLELPTDFATAFGDNDYITITAAGNFSGGRGNDVLDARDASGGVGIFGGPNADWLEGGDFDDFLAGGGREESVFGANGALDGDPLQVRPDILIGGAGDNVYAATSGQSAFDGEPDRETVYVLNGGAEKIFGPLNDVGAVGSAEVIGETFANAFDMRASLAAEALDGDTIIGFDTDDYIILPLNFSSFGGNQTLRDSFSFNIDVPLLSFVPTTVNASATVANSSGLILVNDANFLGGFEASTEGLDNIDILNVISPELDAPVGVASGSTTIDFLELFLAPPVILQPSLTKNISLGINRAPAAPNIVSYSIETDAKDDNGGASPTTEVSVSLHSFDFELDLTSRSTTITSSPQPPFGFPDTTATARYQITGELTPQGTVFGNSRNDNDVSFTFELEGQYRDRFVVDLVPLSATSAAPFIEFGAPFVEEIDASFETYTALSRSEVLAATSDGRPLGFAIRYVSEAPDPVADTATVQRGEAVTFDLTANDVDADGDAIGIFDIVFDSAEQEAALLDGDASNGELLLETDPNTGFGTGLVTYVAPEDFTGEVHFRYIAEDGEFQSDPADVTIAVTGKAPDLGDDVIVLPFSTDGFIAFADIFANDADPDGEALDLASLLTDPAAGDLFALVPDAGLQLSAGALADLRADPVGADGVITSAKTLSYTLDDIDDDGRSDAATVTIAIAAAFDLALPAAVPLGSLVAGDAPPAAALVDEPDFTVAEDSAITIDLLAGRAGGFGDAEIVEVTSAVAEGTEIEVGSVEITADGVVFTPRADLANVVAVFTATARDQAGQEASVEVRVGVTPTDDAPEVVVLSPTGDPTTIQTDEDVAVSGELVLFDVDAADPETLGLEAALDLLTALSVDPASLDPATLAPLAASLPTPASFDPITTSLGGVLQLAPTAAPGVLSYNFTPIDDANGDDLAEIQLLPLAGEAAGDVALAPIAIAPVNDAPTFAAAPFDAANPAVFVLGETLIVDLLSGADDVDGAIDPPSLQIDAGPSAEVTTATLTPEGLLQLTGLSAGAGSLTFSIADDEGLRSAPQTLHFRVNTAPEANDDVVRLLAPFAPITIDPLANDSDAEGAVTLVIGPDGVPAATAAPLVDENGAPLGDAAETLGEIAFDETAGLFVYTPADGVDLHGLKDTFFYSIEDADGAEARASIVIEFIDPASPDPVLRIGSALVDLIEPGPEAELFVLGAGADRLEGPLASFDGDEIFDLQPDDVLLFTDPAVGDVSVTAVRDRAPLPGPTAVDPTAPTAAELFGTTSSETLTDAFIGDTLVTVEIGGETATFRLNGAFLGDFTATPTSEGVALTYAPTLEGPGQLDGGVEDDDIRGTGALNGGGGDDILRGEGPTAALDGGEGNDVLIATGAAGFVQMTGGAGADLFLLLNPSGPYDILDFNPAEGDRIGLAKGAFLNDDLTADLTLLAVTALDDGVFLLEGLPGEDDPDGTPATPLARFTLPQAENSSPDIVTETFAIDENQTEIGVVEAIDADLGDAPLLSLAADAADNALFDFDPETGALAFKTAPDFESPADADGDNVYEARFVVSDGKIAVEESVLVTVGDVLETVSGSGDDDRLEGGPGDDIFESGGGRVDLVFLGGGRDIVRFGGETSNGLREREMIFGFGDDDFLDLGGAAILREINTPTATILQLSGGDNDLVYLLGVTDFDETTQLIGIDVS